MADNRWPWTNQCEWLGLLPPSSSTGRPHMSVGFLRGLDILVIWFAYMQMHSKQAKGALTPLPNKDLQLHLWNVANCFEFWWLQNEGLGGIMNEVEVISINMNILVFQERERESIVRLRFVALVLLSACIKVWNVQNRSCDLKTLALLSSVVSIAFHSTTFSD